MEFIEESSRAEKNAPDSSDQQFSTSDSTEASRPSPFLNLLGWVIWNLVMVWGVSLLTIQLQRFFSPWLIFPFLIGGVWGVQALSMASLFRVTRAGIIPWGIMLTALLLVIGQHQAGYLQACGEYENAPKSLLEIRNINIAMQKSAPILGDNISQAEAGLSSGDMLAESLFPDFSFPDNLWDFLVQQSKQGRNLGGGIKARGGWAWASWALDGGLLLGGAFFVTRVGSKWRNQVGRSS